MAFPVTMIVPSLTTALAMTTGATTVTVKLCTALWLGVPLSVTRTVTVFVVPEKAREGVQLNTPLPASTTAPPGAASRLKLGVWGGASGSVAVAVTTTRLPAWTVRLGMAASVGAVLTSNVAGSLGGGAGEVC